MAYSGRVAPSIDAFEEKTTQENLISGQHHMDTDIPVTSDGAPEDNTQHGSNLEEDTKMDALANGQNLESSLENHSNGGTDVEAGGGDRNVPPESNSDETNMEE